MTAPTEPNTEPLHIGHLLGETLRFIFTRPHLWLMAWAAGFLVGLFGVWQLLTAIAPSEAYSDNLLQTSGVDYYWVISSMTFTAAISPLIYRIFLRWRLPTASPPSRSKLAGIARAAPFIALATIACLGMAATARLQQWSSVPQSMGTLLSILNFFFWLMVYGAAIHISTMSGALDKKRGWKAGFRLTYGNRRALLLVSIPLVALSGILFLISYSVLVGIPVAVPRFFEFSWPTYETHLAGDIITAAAIFLICASFALPFQVFHAAAHIRLIEIHEGTALGSDIEKVIE
ncbi:MAG: hypothetical protein ACPGGK_14100 [Pikeienuella sp.]